MSPFQTPDRLQFQFHLSVAVRNFRKRIIARVRFRRPPDALSRYHSNPRRTVVAVAHSQSPTTPRVALKPSPSEGWVRIIEAGNHSVEDHQYEIFKRWRDRTIDLDTPDSIQLGQDRRAHHSRLELGSLWRIRRARCVSEHQGATTRGAKSRRPERAETPFSLQAG